MVVTEIDEDSPAANVGLKKGDVIKSAGDHTVTRAIDLERAMLGRQVGDKVELSVERDRRPVTLEIALADAPEGNSIADASWQYLGMKLTPMPEAQFNRLGTRYRGGLSVTAVRPDGPAARQGIRRGDVLVGMQKWETTTMNHVSYVLSRPEFVKLEPVKFYIVRGHETLSGQLTAAPRSSVAVRSKSNAAQ